MINFYQFLQQKDQAGDPSSETIYQTFLSLSSLMLHLENEEAKEKEIEEVLRTYLPYFKTLPSLSIDPFEKESVEGFGEKELLISAIESFALYAAKEKTGLSSLLLSVRYLLTLDMVLSKS